MVRNGTTFQIPTLLDDKRPMNPSFLDHEEWLDYVQAVGLIVSLLAIRDAERFSIATSAVVTPDSSLRRIPDSEPVPDIRDFAAFAKQIFMWADNGLTACSARRRRPTDYHETVRPYVRCRSEE